MHEIAAARDWQDKLAVQSSFFSGSLQRLQGVFARYMAMTGDLSHGPLQAGAGNGKTTGTAAAAA